MVVANAGVAPPSDTVASIEPAEFERTIDIDLLGQWRTIRATLPEVTERQGHILVIGSIYAFFNGVLNASYAASKAGVEQLIRAVRVELAPHDQDGCIDLGGGGGIESVLRPVANSQDASPG